MDRINHVKIASPDPERISRFLSEVVDIPEGWPMGPVDTITPRVAVSPARDDDGEFTRAAVLQFRGAGEDPAGFIVGDGTSREFQVVAADAPRIWGVAIGTRDVEGAHERCEGFGAPCTEILEHTWNEGTITFFYAEVGGVVFEVMRINP
ncbi:MAG TPA: VOC family protein [Acidimicrobiales bacterium]